MKQGYVRKLTVTAMLAAISVVLMYLQISVPFMPAFIQFDFSDLPALIGAYAFGPVAGVVIVLLKNVIHLLVSQTAWIGELSNFILGVLFVLPAGLIYKMKKNKAGALVGSMGVVLYCLLTSGLRGMPGWALGNLLIGLIMGFAFRVMKHRQNRVFKWFVCVMAAVAGAALGILGIKSGVEFVLYGQPFWFRVAKNLYAFAADVFVMVLSLPLCARLDRWLDRYTEEKV